MVIDWKPTWNLEWLQTKKGVVGKISDTFIILNVCILDWLLLKKNALNVSIQMYQSRLMFLFELQKWFNAMQKISPYFLYNKLAAVSWRRFYLCHDTVMTWKCFFFPYNWPFVGGVHQSLLDSPHRGLEMQNCDFLLLLLAWISSWTKNWDAVTKSSFVHQLLSMIHIFHSRPQWVKQLCDNHRSFIINFEGWCKLFGG